MLRKILVTLKDFINPKILVTRKCIHWVILVSENVGIFRIGILLGIFRVFGIRYFIGFS